MCREPAAPWQRPALTTTSGSRTRLPRPLSLSTAGFVRVAAPTGGRHMSTNAAAAGRPRGSPPPPGGATCVPTLPAPSSCAALLPLSLSAVAAAAGALPPPSSSQPRAAVPLLYRFDAPKLRALLQDLVALPSVQDHSRARNFDEGGLQLGIRSWFQQWTSDCRRPDLKMVLELRARLGARISGAFVDVCIHDRTTGHALVLELKRVRVSKIDWLAYKPAWGFTTTMKAWLKVDSTAAGVEVSDDDVLGVPLTPDYPIDGAVKTIALCVLGGERQCRRHSPFVLAAAAAARSAPPVAAAAGGRSPPRRGPSRAAAAADGRNTGTAAARSPSPVVCCRSAVARPACARRRPRRPRDEQRHGRGRGRSLGGFGLAFVVVPTTERGGGGGRLPTSSALQRWRPCGRAGR